MKENENAGAEMTLLLKGEAETERLGLAVARHLKAGDVVALTGELGTGKTTLAKAIAKGLGIAQTLVSPTFTIVQEYEGGRLPLYHFDVYRVHGEEELFEIGFEEYLHAGGVCLIEWADLIEPLLPPDAIRIALSYAEGEDERICVLR